MPCCPMTLATQPRARTRCCRLRTVLYKLVFTSMPWCPIRLDHLSLMACLHDGLLALRARARQQHANSTPTARQPCLAAPLCPCARVRRQCTSTWGTCTRKEADKGCTPGPCPRLLVCVSRGRGRQGGRERGSWGKRVPRRAGRLCRYWLLLHLGKRGGRGGGGVWARGRDRERESGGKAGSCEARTQAWRRKLCAASCVKQGKKNMWVGVRLSA